MNNSSFQVTVSSSDTSIDARIVDARTDALTIFGPLSPGQQTSLAGDAWLVGLRALTNAYRHADESRLKDIGSTLVENIDEQLGAYVEKQQAAFVQVLARYFDPRDGQVVGRLDNFVREGGDLTTTLNKFLGPDGGVLAQTLARAVGETSPLFRKLSATDSEGVLCLLEQKLAEVLAANQAQVARALDPVSEDGAVARFLRALQQELQRADQDRIKQLAVVTKQLDASDESSLLSRLMRETQDARRTLVQAMNPEVTGSPMAVLKSAVTSMLQEHAKTHQESMAAFQERQAKLDQEIRDALARLEERRRLDAKSPRGGFGFEDAVLRFVERAVAGAPVIAEPVGCSVGSRPNCKVGDQVVRFTDESIYAGAALVVEAKHDAGYTVTKALQELEVGRSNRDAQAGLFVMARSHAPAGFPNFARYGSDILVIWDDEDEATDAYLHAALLLGLALASRRKRPDDGGNLEALADVEHRITKELGRLEKMRKLSESIQKNAQELSDEIRKGGDKLNLLLKKAKSTLKALNVELCEAEEERSTPVLLPEGSLVQARSALAAQNEVSAEDLKSA